MPEPSDISSSMSALWTSFLEGLVSAAGTIASWLLYFAVFLGIYGVWRFVRRRRRVRPGISVALSDLTADDGRQAQASWELTGELALAIRRFESPPAGRSGPVTGWESAQLDFGGESLGELAKLSTHIAETPISVGPVSFSPRQLFRSLSALSETRTEFTIQGALRPADGLTLTAEKHDENGRPITGAVFTASATGPAARSQVLEAVAAQLTVHLAESVVTHNWRSLTHLVRGQHLLSEIAYADDYRELLERAISELKSSLSHDQGNWVARFELATALRTAGQFHSSACQFDFLRTRLLASDSARRSRFFRDFLERHTDFLWLLGYHEALSRCRIGRWSQTRRAIHQMETLFAEQPKGSADLTTVAGRQTLRHEVMLRGLRAECSTAHLEALRYEPRDDEGLNAKRRSLLDQVQEDESWIWNRSGDFTGADAAHYAAAHLMARTALGRAQYLLGRYEKAVSVLRWAIEFNAGPGSTPAKLHLASTYIRARNSVSPAWADLAEPLLLSIVEDEPHHPKANYLLGKLNRDPAKDDIAAAKRYFAAGGNDAGCMCGLGVLQLDSTDPEEINEGFAQIRGGFSRLDEIDFTHYYCLDAIRAYLDRGQAIPKRYKSFVERVAQQLSQSTKKSWANLGRALQKRMAEKPKPKPKRELEPKREPEPKVEVEAEPPPEPAT